MFLLRPARVDDLEAIFELAAHLDSQNLPTDRDFLRGRLERSERAFAHPGPPCVEREYQLALVDAAGAVVGTCAILSKHGTPDMPHVYLRVGVDERSARSVPVSVRHRTLTLGTSEDGPTELGALVLHPDLRGHPESPGKLLSWGRFAYLGRHPAAFERSILAEMRASLDEPGGRNRFWDAFGARFTGLPYAEANRLSAEDKSFILDLFPSTTFYATLLDPDIARDLGRVHPAAAPALRLLETAGLHWNGEIDPFDAGPYYAADVSEIVPIRDTRSGSLAAETLPDAGEAPVCIASTEEDGGFRAVAAPADLEAGEVQLPKEARRRLEIGPGDEVSLTPFPPRRGAGRG